MRQISRTRIKKHLRLKTSPEIKETIAMALKHKEWSNVAKILASSTRKHSALNLFQIDKEAKEKDNVIITGKVLSKGDLTKKIKISALSISGTAKAKLKDTKSEFVYLVDEIKKNPKAQGVRILK